MNFVTGWVLIALLPLISIEYMIHGRYHRIAFLREERVSKKLVKECRALMTNLYYYVAKAQAERVIDTKSRLLKTWVFLLTGLVLTIVCTISYFVLAMSAIFFRSMILWRNFSFPIPFEKTVALAIQAMASAMNFKGLDLLFYPFVALFNFFSN